MKKIISSSSFFLFRPFNFIKKIKINGFFIGLISGAIFSLLVNMVTVKIQEIISKQRVLEALEMEIMMHNFHSRSLFDRTREVWNADNSKYMYIEMDIAQRYSSTIGESGEVLKYLFEISPELSAEIQTYYNVYIDKSNRLMDRNEELFVDSYKECDIPYLKMKGLESKSIEECNEIAKWALYFHDVLGEGVEETSNEILEDFHPTQDRLDSFWLKLFLGDETIEMLRRE